MAAIYVHLLRPLLVILFTIATSSLAYHKMLQCLGVCICDDIFLRISCSDTMMEVLPYGLPWDYHSLLLKNNNFQNLTPQNFNVSTLRDLRELSLVNSNVEFVQNGTLGMLTKLVSLDLGRNYLHELPYEIRFMTKLQLLDMQSNFINTISAETFKALKRLRHLFLGENLLDVSQIEAGIFSSLIWLRKLTITGRVSSENYDDLYHMMNASSQSSYESFTLTTSTYFTEEVNTTPCVNVASWFAVPRRNLSLVELVLSQNSINCLHASSFSAWFSQLQILDLSANQLEFLPVEVFAPLVALDKLNLDGNYLRYIPHGIFDNNVNLRILHLRGNALVHISPETLSPLSNSLHEIDLSWNRLRSWNATAEATFVSLEKLIIRGNEISDEEGPLTFKNIPNLLELRLGNNRLQYLPNVTGMRFLREIWLSNNRIRRFPKNAFKGCEQLRLISIPRNRLRSVPKTIIPQAGNLTRLIIKGNPLKCDCHLRWMVITLRKPEMFHSIHETIFETKCDTPAFLNNKSLFQALNEHETYFICSEYPEPHHITWLIATWLSLLAFVVACKLYNIFPGSRRNFRIFRWRRRARVLEDDPRLVEIVNSNRKRGQYELVRDVDVEQDKQKHLEVTITESYEPKLPPTPSKLDKVNWHTMPETSV